ncbi:MAG: CheR family methyltransferase [Thermodesulfobacteriota bacterium]
MFNQVIKSTTLRKEIKISDSEFEQLRDFIYQQTGIFIGDNRKYLLENRLANRLKEHNLNSFAEYYYFLKYDPARRQELNRLFAVITTNETSFFRNPPQIKVFQDSILPEVLELKRKKGNKRLRLWSAGCSTGEEPYTLGIVLQEVLGREVSQWDIRILAHDLSEDVLQSARRGVYNEYTLRSTPKHILERYFQELSQGNYKILPQVQELVSFGTLNLSDRFQLKQLETADIIFCRNVIIYFDEAMKKQVISGMYDNLLPGGYLFVGHSESLHNLSRAFKPCHFPGAIVYKKEG